MTRYAKTDQYGCIHTVVNSRHHKRTDGATMDEIEEIKQQLEHISEMLNDAAMRMLSEAIENGSHHRPDAEKKVSQARRAVDKARLHLDDISID